MDKNFNKTGITETLTRDFKNSLSQKKKVFSNEFKSDVVQEVLNGADRKETASKYGISTSTLQRWIRESEAVPEDDNQEIQKLLMENERLKRIILMLLDI